MLRNFTLLGNWPTVVGVSVAAAAWLVATGHRRAALLLLGITLIGRLLVEGIKLGVHRARPDAVDHLVAVYSLSFPSGHSANSMIVYLGIALLAFDNPQHRRPAAIAAALLLTFLIGLSRPMLGVHWPSDVIAGWAFGAVLAAGDARSAVARRHRASCPARDAGAA